MVELQILSTLSGSALTGLIAKLDTTRVGDAGSTRTVLLVSAVLVIFAFALIGVTVWFWRNTVPDPDALESLATFEERVIDGTEDPEVERRRPTTRADADERVRRPLMSRPHGRGVSNDNDERTLKRQRPDVGSRDRRFRREH